MLNGTGTAVQLSDVAAHIVRRAVMGYGGEQSLEKYAGTLTGDLAAAMQGTVNVLREVARGKATEVVVGELRDSMRVARELIERGEVEAES